MAVELNQERFDAKKNRSYSVPCKPKWQLGLLVFIYRNTALFLVAVELNSRLGRQLLRYTLNQENVGYTTTRLTLTSTPGTETGRLHFEASSTLTAGP